MTYPFVTTLLFHKEQTPQYDNALQINRFQITMNQVKKGGVKTSTKKRVLNMWQYGGTIGPARYPKYLRDVNIPRYSMLPRPVTLSRPGEMGHTIMTYSHWLQHLVTDVEELTLQFLAKMTNTNFSTTVMKHVTFSKNNVPSCLRICDTCFTQMVFLGFEKEGQLPAHRDNDDYINAVCSFGDDTVKGGTTLYFDGMNTKQQGKVVHKVPFCHGRVQIGFYHAIVHGASNWTGGRRGTINLAMKRQLLKHFYEHGDRYYSQFRDAGYPRGDFVAK